MSRRSKFLDKVKTIFRRESPRAGHPPENNVLVDAPGPLPGNGTHNSRPDAHVDGNRRGANVAGDRHPEAAEGRVNGAIRAPVRLLDRERIVGETVDTVPNSILGAADLERQGTNRQEISDWQAIGNVPRISDHLNHRVGVHRAEAGKNQDGELDVPSGPPNPMGHSQSESMTFGDIKHSGISIGSGPVNVNNTSFSGGVHSHNPSERIRPGLELLQKCVAPSAFHNSAHRVNPPRCHPDTRVAIRKHIYDWIVLELFVRQTWIMWMHGAAGAGKSAIMQSVAELCEQAEVPLASFFFFRTDPTRNSMAPFIATLVYQLIQKIPQVRDVIFTIIESNPLIFDESLESQLQKVIIQPLLQLPNSKLLKHYFVVMIDGLDECLERAHQIDLIQTLAAVSRSRLISVVFLVVSRREPQIEAAFTRDEVSELALILPLDNSDIEQTSDDIRHFLVDKFRDIKKTHLFKHYLPADWPPASSVEEIISKSSGQFIFASTVIKYILSPRANPARQLEVICGIRLGDPSQNPFVHLDALYKHILSQVEALDKVLDIIGYVIISGMDYVENIQEVFLLEPGELVVLFADLTAVILCEPPTYTYGRLKFLHASLPDFLVNESRSERYHINLDEYRTNLLCRFLKSCPPILDLLWSKDDLGSAICREKYRFWAINKLLEKAKASERLCMALMNFNCTFYSETFFEDRWHRLGPKFLSCLKQLDFNDQGEAYCHVKDIFAAEYVKYWPSIDSDVKQDIERESPDLAARIKQIQVQVT